MPTKKKAVKPKPPKYERIRKKVAEEIRAINALAKGTTEEQQAFRKEVEKVVQNALLKIK